jgi:hypothetical protein
LEIPSIYNLYLEVNRNVINGMEEEKHSWQEDRSMLRIKKKMKGWRGPRETGITKN